MKKMIVWDFDDTINNFRFDFYLNHFKGNFNYNNIQVKNYYSLLEITKNEFMNKLIKFKGENIDKITVNKEVYNWFYEKGNLYNHILLTEVSYFLFPKVIEWCIQYFSKWFRSYNFIHPQLDIITKAEYIEKYFKQVDIFIDDDEENCKQVKQLGIKTYCPKQPWNNGLDINDILKEI